MMGKGWRHRQPRGGFVRVLASALMTVSLGSLAGSPVGADDPPTTQTAVAHAGALVGRTEATKQITLAVPLKVRNEQELEAFLHDLYDPSSPQFHHFLTPAEYTKRFIDASARKDVGNFLRGQGLTVTDHGLGSIVNATGSVAQVEQAFKVTLSDYKDGAGHMYYENDRTPAIPASVAASIHGVIGLDDATHDHPHFVLPPIAAPPSTQSDQPHTPSGCAAAVNIANRYGSYTPNQFSTAYNFDFFAQRALYGQGQTVALLEEDDYRDSNIVAYTNCFAAGVPISRVPVDGGAVLGQSGGGEVEVELDIDVIVGMAPLLGQLLVYESPTSVAAVTDQYQRIANDNLAQVVSTSWGNCEQNRSSTTLNARYAIFQQMAVQGQSMFAAAGDTGSGDCANNPNILAVDDPASQPYVTGVGGTRLTIFSNNQYSSETIWNDAASSHGAGGGGISTVWTKLAYQTGPGTVNAYSNGKRQVPDVSADADPFTAYTVFVHDATNCPGFSGIAGTTDCFLPIGGTSAAAPLWAVGTALTNQYLISLGLTRVGFMNPVIYPFLANVSVNNSISPFPFHDITVGNNCYKAACGIVYPATTAYDEASGIGTMNIGGFALSLSPPTLASLSTPSGGANGGTSLTITGANFQMGATVTFGGVAATGVTVNSPTQITVTTPPHAAGVVDVVVTNPTGRSGTLSAAFTYVAVTVANITPNTSGTAGLIPVTIVGSNFVVGATVSIGGIAATSVTVVNSTTITGVVPAHPAAFVDVVVTNPDGLSGTLARAFRYIERPGPVIPGASPASEPQPRSGDTTGSPSGPAPPPRT